MLQNYRVPKQLKTLHFPGQKMEIWINEKKVRKLDDVDPKERTFMKDFIDNLEELGWEVLIQL